MKKPTPQIRRLAVLLTAQLAALAAFVSTSQAQVTFSQVTNGLVDWYPLDYVVTNGATLTAFDYLNGRDMTLFNMNGGNVIASTRPSSNPSSVSNCFNFDQQLSGVGNTIMYYDAKAQNQLTGGGDFLPFFNQINATMSFWIKRTASTGVSTYNDKRFFGECDASSGQSGPICLFGTSSGGGLPTDTLAHFLLRQKSSSPGNTVPDPLVDGTFEVPNLANHWVQGNSYTTNTLLDGSWHLFTMTIDSNRIVDIYVDGVRDSGPPGAFTDGNGNPGYGPDMPLTNFYYTTNIYPGTGVSNPPPNGYVRWVWNALFKTGNTAFGGFRRNGANTGGFPMLIDDIGFWNRKLSVDEIEFVRTNGLPGIPLVRPFKVNTFTADFAEVGQGDSVTLRWNVLGALTNNGSGGIVISGVGDVSSKGLIGSTNVTLGVNQTYNFTLTINNGVSTTNASVTVKAFHGVTSGWHLIQRFDGVFNDTFSDPISGIGGNSWVSAGSDFSGSFDKWNVYTLNTGGASNKVLTPRTGYAADVNGPGGFESRGALAYGRLGSLTMQPGMTNTLFFRFSLQETLTANPGVFSDMDFGVGLSDYGFLGPSGGLGFYGGTGGGFGPYFSILRNSAGAFTGAPFDLFAPDAADAADGNTAATYSYIASVDPNGLQTNVNYLVWMDIVDRNTHAEVDTNTLATNTVMQAQFTVWLQKQGDPSRTLLFTNFHGNRNYVGFNPVNDNPVPFMDKVFFNIGNESIVGGAAGSYFTTNMIAVDDVYMSSGVNSTIPRLFDITSVVKGSTSVSLTWESLGSLFQANTYTVQRRFQLSDPWTNIATGVNSGGDSTTYVDSTVGSSSTAFYRIVWP